MKIAFASLKTKTNKAKLLEKDDRENTHCAISQVTSLFFGYTEYSASYLSSLGCQSWLQQETKHTFKLALSSDV